MRSTTVRSLSSALCVLLALSCAGSAEAQTGPLDTQRFYPAVTHDGFLMLEGSSCSYAIDPFKLGLWMSYGHNPLVTTDAAGDLDQRIVGAQLAWNVTASMAFLDWLELGIDIPFAYLNGDGLSEMALGDIRMVTKFTILDDRRDVLGLGAIAEVRFPTHISDFYGGDRMVSFAPRMLLDHRFGLTGLRLGMSAGVLLRLATDYYNVHGGPEFTLGAAIAYRFLGGAPWLEILAEWQMAIGLVEPESEEIAGEILGSMRFHVSPEWQISAGMGVGVIEGYGVPMIRPFVGVTWEPAPNDPDGDGKPTDPPDGQERYSSDNYDGGQGEEGAGGEADSELAEDAAQRGYDACPDLPEDYDGDEDEDGCPEGDEDGDGVLDMFDRCEDEAETINGYDDDDGCPDEGPAKVIVQDGKLVVLETIRFKLNSDELEPESEPILNQITLTLRARRDISVVRIEGHTDNTGSREHNMDLSARRARSVKQALVEQGIKGHRIQTRGYGPDRPIATNDTDEGRSINRRVEFIIIGK